jgi:hypothetical protein
MAARIAPAPGHQAAPLASGDVRSTRACDYCRSLKVRCISSNSPSAKCRRCARSDRDCIMTGPQKRKQRKRTDTRVAELEREVRAMQAAVNRTEGASSPTNSEGTTKVRDSIMKKVDQVLRGARVSCPLFIAHHLVERSSIPSTPCVSLSFENGASLGKLRPYPTILQARQPHSYK